MGKTTQQSKNRNNEFVKNTIILFIGKFATQFISLLLLPLYTRFLLTEDYGSIDLLQTYISLFVPILTLRVDSAVFRFLIDKREKNDEKCKIITNISLITFLGVLLTTFACLIIYKSTNIKYFSYVIINLIILMISNVMLQMLRGLGKNTHYSISSIITGIVTLVSNIIMIVFLKKGAESILISSSIANVFCIIFAIISTSFFKYINIKLIDKTSIKEILDYSLPMIPNSLSWWIVNVSDRTIVSYFLGTAFNGIYTVSCKFSNILNSIFSIFNMSWQETASLHINDDDKDTFFSDMINNILILFSSMGLVILGCLAIFYNIIIGKKYIDSYNYIPILLYANTWNVLIGLIGGIYVAQKKTKEIASTTIVSAVLNIIINLAMIKFVGLYAACVSTLLSYFIMGMYRYFDCKKYVDLKLNFKSIIIFSLVFLISSLIYLSQNLILNILDLLLIMLYCLIANKKVITPFITALKNKILKVHSSF